MTSAKPHEDISVTQDHSRQWRNQLYVYPVVSRRSRGVSVGVNLNFDKRCNFRCMYCQVNRRAGSEAMADLRFRHNAVDLKILGKELRRTLKRVASGRLWREKRFAKTPEDMRRLNDIAFSGDGEPTCMPEFDQALAVAASVKAKLKMPEVKLVVITNASQLSTPQFLRAIPILQQSNGEIWAKLDAGTEEGFQRINRPASPQMLDEICNSIIAVSKEVPVAIQTLLFRIAGHGPSAEETEAYCDRVRSMVDAGAKIREIQLHTIARSPAEHFAIWLEDDELDAIGQAIRAALPDIPVNICHGANMPPQ